MKTLLLIAILCLPSISFKAKADEGMPLPVPYHNSDDSVLSDKDHIVINRQTFNMVQKLIAKQQAEIKDYQKAIEYYKGQLDTIQTCVTEKQDKGMSVRLCFPICNITGSQCTGEYEL